MNPTVHVVASCTKRKLHAPVCGLQMRDLPNVDVLDRFAAWTQRVDRCTSSVRALDLYAGDHWSSVRQLAALRSADLWICSAGLGLIRSEAKVPAYSATFSRSHPDSVARAKNSLDARGEMYAWWAAQRKWSGPDRESVRDIASLAEENTKAFFVVVAAGEYLRVMTPEITRASSILESPEQLTIFSADAFSSPHLNHFCVPIDARLSADLGGSLHSLNARAARHALARLDGEAPTRNALTKIMEDLMESAKPRSTHNRIATSDNEVAAFIRDSLRSNPKARKTVLLRELRDKGRACEQARFGRIYDRLKADSNE